MATALRIYPVNSSVPFYNRTAQFVLNENANNKDVTFQLKQAIHYTSVSTILLPETIVDIPFRANLPGWGYDYVLPYTLFPRFINYLQTKYILFPDKVLGNWFNVPLDLNGISFPGIYNNLESENILFASSNVDDFVILETPETPGAVDSFVKIQISNNPHGVFQLQKQLTAGDGSIKYESGYNYHIDSMCKLQLSGSITSSWPYNGQPSDVVVYYDGTDWKIRFNAGYGGNSNTGVHILGYECRCGN